MLVFVWYTEPTCIAYWASKTDIEGQVLGPSILSQTYNVTLFLFDYLYANAHALSKLFHSINSSFNQASNHVFVVTICLKMAKKQ